MFDNILKKAMKKGHNIENNNFKQFKPKKEFIISDKPVQVFNNNPIPKKSVIKKAYDKIPDDTSIPLQFMTRKQYMNKYIKNQEHINNIDFPIEQEKSFIKQRTPHYANITGRYTTRNNPYYPPAVVVFNDKNNLKNIKGDNFAKLAWHEYGHELVEKKNIKLPLHKEEFFADRIADIGTNNKIFCDTKAKNQIFDEMFERKIDKRNRIPNIRMANIYQERFPEKDEESLNKFTAHPRYEQAQELTAAQKFGGKNLQGLQKIGQGRDRVVYALDDDKVLKVAKNPGGLTQNTGETDLQFLGMGQQLEEGKDYVVMQRQQPLSKQGKQKLAKLRKTVTGIDGDEHKKRVALSADDSVLDQTGITRDILNYDYNSSELFANRQWGEDEQGNPVLVDGGALQDNRTLSKYRVKDYAASDWQYTDWQDIQNQRRQFKDKGTYDKEQKFNKGYLEGDLDNNVILEDDYSENMAEFSIEQEKEIYGLDWNKDQRGKKIGEGHFGRVYEVKDNPNYIIKTSKEKEDQPKNFVHGNITDIDREQYKYDKYLKDEPLIIPSLKTGQGIVRPKLNIITTGMSKDNYKTYGTKNKEPVLTKNEATQVRDQVNKLTARNINVGDELQVGRDTKGNIYFYDLGEFRQSPDYRHPRVKDDNRDYLKRFLRETGREEVKDWDEEKESEDAIKEINNIETDDYSENKLNFWKKKEEPEPANYPNITNQDFRNELEYRQRLQQDSYGVVKDYSGAQVGNTMIAADVVIPSGKLLTAAGFGVKKYVDKVKFIKTDEHDNKYKVPRIEVHKKRPETDDYSYDKYEQEAQEYIQCPIDNKGKGRCADAAQGLVTTAIQEGIPKDNIKVMSVVCEHPFKGRHKSGKLTESRHIITQINDKIYDPTRTQYGMYDDYEFDNVPSEYSQITELPVDAYIRKDTDSKNDKIYFPQRIKDKGIEFSDNVSPRKQRILTKTLRKNPELLKTKGDSKIELGTFNVGTTFGTTAGVEELRNSKFYYKPNEYKVAFNEQIFGQKYDPKFINYVSKKTIREDELTDEYLEQELKTLPITQQKHSAKHDVPRTLTHEFTHVGQIEKKQGNIMEFKEDYDKQKELYGYQENPYEIDARAGAELQEQERKNRYKDTDMSEVYFYNNDIDVDIESKNMPYLYSYRPEDEDPQEVYPSETQENMNIGRGTGWTGTGIYAYGSEKSAEKERYAYRRMDYGKGPRKLKKVWSDNPKKLNFDFEYNKYEDTSKDLFKLKMQTQWKDKGIEKYNPEEEKQLRKNIYYNMLEIGIGVSEDDVNYAIEQSKESEEQPINFLMKKKGYDALIADDANDTYRTGSVYYGGKEDIKGKLIDVDTDSKNDKIIYRNESFPGYNVPKPYEGTQKYKFRVLAKDKNNIGVVNFGHSDYEDYTIHKDPKRRKNFRARHNCDPVSELDKLSARYWSCQHLW